MELWDAYDKDGNKLGFDLVRDAGFPENVYHLVCDTVVRHVDGSFLLMQRDLNKNGWPGAWQVGAGGSALKGESPIEGAMRELREEAGVVAERLEEIYRCLGGHAIYYGYLCVTDCPKDSVTLQEGETIAYKWVTKEEFIAFMDSEEGIVVQKERLVEFVESLR